jgi:hypothetical protein
VTVSDGRGGAFRESWEIIVKNREPELTLVPASQVITLTEGAQQTFKATSSDPDGDPVSTRFRLDGEEVESGPTYRFSAGRPGSYQLEVVAEDAAGGETVLSRSIRVSEAPRRVAKVEPPPRPPEPAPKLRLPEPEPKLRLPEPEAKLRPPEPAPKPRLPEPAPKLRLPEPEPKPRPQGSDWRTGVNRTFQRYEAALEQKDIQHLEDVWLLPPDSMYRQRWIRKFARPEPLEIDIDLRSMDPADKNGERVVVVYAQKESSQSRSRTYTYRAVLLKRKTTNDWQIIDNSLFKN